MKGEPWIVPNRKNCPNTVLWYWYCSSSPCSPLFYRNVQSPGCPRCRIPQPVCVPDRAHHYRGGRRGNITDRNGNLIVGNQQTYTLTFDASLLPDDADTNEAILRLVNLCIENNVAYTDNVPLSADAPFTYTPYRSSTAESNFKRYLEKTLQPAGKGNRKTPQ